MININASHHTVHGRDYYRYESSRAPSGCYAEGDLQVSGRSDEQMKEISIINTMSYLGINRWDIAGQENTKPVAAIPSKLEIQMQNQVISDTQAYENAAQQLTMKASSLSNPLAIWSDQSAYDLALISTNKAISDFNNSPQPNTGLIQAQPLKSSDSKPSAAVTEQAGLNSLSILAIPIFILVMIFYLIFRR